MNDGKWVIRKCTCSDNWHVYDPDEHWSGDFSTWSLAMLWVTDPTWRIEHYLMTTEEIR